MSRKAELYEDCERCYIQEDMTFGEIAARFELAEKTVRLWADEGKWRERRNSYRTQRASLDEKLHKFVDKLMDTILADWEQGNQVDPGRMYAFNNLLGKLDKVRKYEDQKKVGAAAEQDQAEADPEVLTQRVREVLGLNR